MAEPSKFLSQLEDLLEEFEALRTKSEHKDLSDQPKHVRQGLITRAIAAATRISGNSSPYAEEIRRLQATTPELHRHTSSIMGVATALRDDLKTGHLETLVEIAHADVFGDFLSMAEHLVEAGYKDAAAVIAGSTLESHLRSLCVKQGVNPHHRGGKGDGRPKKLDRLNTDLAKAGVYGKLDQKSVTAWADLRNKAAHGKYTEYDVPQVREMITGVTNFIRRLPA